MTETGFFIGWGGRHPGREHEATKLFTETIEIFTELERAGEIESFEPVLLGPHGGDLDGYILVRGEPAKLLELQLREDMQALQLRAMTVHAKFSVIPATIGTGVQHQLELIDELVSKLERPLVTI